MVRITSLALFGLAAVGLAVDRVRADLPVAPAPREIRPDGSRDPVPQPAKAEDPAVVVDRIIKNSKDVGDKLAGTDAGPETQKKQDKILADIDALINRQEDPPPPKPDDNKDKDKEKNKDPNMNQDPPKGDMPPPNGGGMPMDKNMGMGGGKHSDNPMGGMPPMNGKDMGGMGMGGMDMGGMGGTNEPPPGGGRRPRRGGEPKADDKKEQGEQKPEGGGNEKTPSGGSKDAKNPKNPSGGGGGGGDGKNVPQAALPFDEDVAKDVWGHLQPKLRQQMTQYYKEDVMPKYTELLRLYYSALADKGAPAGAPKK
jgi:hypothetical protein